ncbi:Ser/Thr protein phosphatase, putative [Trichomonas vaginalis G3]|uniref:Ser/Thr protein phosphatase, putative n=1 Tax=Trichomonas vaginalis (strain ATCC PRA-98 / G3) TaxID=412133 RepID=A2EFZ8_TRIV3|nr:metallo-dependent phosphatases family [Trichomonas vaginalis G3]EAY08454.1 Ser/Thr protein phosphatase, putative [Trichomonas vaginalis G3]KAI5518114.1 metallo-dependent phosphatases family [Trichomonas vaginalis G3]|eukprot:XP_001320677.1 Ser/Thr protein phosphatase [Trichomonas vaginalis G3]
MTKLLRMINTDANMSVIDYPDLENMRALIFTDSHLCRFYSFEDNFPKLKNYIITLIQRENINTVFTLGDLINIRTEGAENMYLKIFEIFAKLPVQVYAIGGNHDRHILHKLNVDIPNIHIISEFALAIPHPNPRPGTPKRLILSHDFHNHLRLTPEKIPDWLYTIRTSLPNLIKPDDFILTGHTHNTVILSDQLSASLGPLSLDLHTECYAILTMENGINIEFFDSVVEGQPPKSSFISKIYETCKSLLSA